jgi:hypothetical protein
MDDLAGAQLLINFGGTGKRDASIRAAFELAHIALQINGRAVAISPEELTRHTVQNPESAEHGYTFWEYRFPADPDRIFEQPPNRPTRP